MENKFRSRCPITYALDVFGDKWSLIILRDIVIRGKSHYQEFLGAEEGISTNILADRLSKLQSHGLIKKSKSPINNKQIVYSSTEKSRDLVPMMVEIISWSAKYDNNTGVSQAMKTKICENKQSLIDDILSNYYKK